MPVTNISYDRDDRRTHAEPDDAAVGGGGTDILDFFQLSRRAQLDALAGAPFSNASFFALPSGIVTADYPRLDERDSVEADGSAESGDSEDLLDLWQQSRADLLRDLAGAEFTNASSFRVPQGVVNTDYDRGGIDEERYHGTVGRGKFLGAESRPLSGTVSIEDDDGIVASTNGAGRLVVTAPPADGVTAGDPGAGGSVDFRFNPSGPGVDVLEENIGTSYDAGVVQYGAAVGTITDVDDDPVPNDTVKAAGSGASTGSDGTYQFNVPGDTEITLEAVGGKTETVRPAAGETIVVDFQYAGLVVSAVLPDGTAVPNAAIELLETGRRERTGADGEVRFVRAPPSRTVTLTFLGEYTREVRVPDEGQETTELLELAAGVKGDIRSSRGNAISSVDTTFNIEGMPVASSTDDGAFALGIQQAQTAIVSVAAEDRRFERVDREVSLDPGEVIELSIVLQDARPTGNIA